MTKSSVRNAKRKARKHERYKKMLASVAESPEFKGPSPPRISPSPKSPPYDLDAIIAGVLGGRKRKARPSPVSRKPLSFLAPPTPAVKSPTGPERRTRVPKHLARYVPEKPPKSPRKRKAAFIGPKKPPRKLGAGFDCDKAKARYVRAANAKKAKVGSSHMYGRYLPSGREIDEFY